MQCIRVSFPGQKTGQRKGRVDPRCKQKTLSQPHSVLQGTYSLMRKRASSINARAVVAGYWGSEEITTQAEVASQETVASELRYKSLKNKELAR